MAVHVGDVLSSIKAAKDAGNRFILDAGESYMKETSNKRQYSVYCRARSSGCKFAIRCGLLKEGTAREYPRYLRIAVTPVHTISSSTFLPFGTYYPIIGPLSITIERFLSPKFAQMRRTCGPMILATWLRTECEKPYAWNLMARKRTILHECMNLVLVSRRLTQRASLFWRTPRMVDSQDSS
jgi:hypothetical protein